MKAKYTDAYNKNKYENIASVQPGACSLSIPFWIRSSLSAGFVLDVGYDCSVYHGINLSLVIRAYIFR
jgi:hypothetical protein